ncbi:hypothetical protein NCCP691_13350 [Noviherbaspirillum aridicola]|uniref:Uncharacterized protein n=1 Tax=Noviherbaspirillum aridicola TaxID=2849687 RepID=A0ABQ4Q2R2_9BURK|nr:hypothetical protein NCCP691_13350 [Noviherbaspirillum aridicola]
MFAVHIDHLLRHWHCADQEIVGKQDGEVLVADQAFRAEDRVTEAERCWLSYEHALHVVRLC